jgi:hypothetical protein
MMDPGRTVAELFPSDGPGPPPLPGYNKARDLAQERVVDIRPIVVHVSWIAINQKVPIGEQDNRPKPKRFWAGAELHKLQLVTTVTDHLPRVGSKVRWREGVVDERNKPTIHFGNIPFWAHIVTETVTHVDVLWQSGETTRERTTGLMLHANIDEYDCWPGDHVLVKGDEMGIEGREAIVRRVDARERTAEITVVPVKEGEQPADMLVSLLELDPHGQAPGASLPRPATCNGAYRTDSAADLSMLLRHVWRWPWRARPDWQLAKRLHSSARSPHRPVRGATRGD